MIYLVSFTPLEPYTFGTDQTFTYAGTRKTGKESYFANSVQVPEQTTLLGTLRYMVLLHADKLNTGFAYTDEEKAEADALVGSESFSFLKQGQRFGAIHSISPLFLINEETGEALIRNPFHNMEKKSGYCPMRLGEPVETSEGAVRLPGPDAYHAKAGYAGGYLELRGKAIRKDLFSSRFIPGNSKADGESRDKSYFRREVVSLSKGYAFAILTDVDEGSLPDDCIVHMGLKHAAFRAVARSAAEVPAALAELLFTREDGTPAELLQGAVERVLDTGEAWYYALSDLIPPQDFTLDTFSIVEMKSLRNLETTLSEKTQNRKLARSPKRFNLIQAGSVFYGGKPFEAKNENAWQAGYNVICRLGGR